MQSPRSWYRRIFLAGLVGIGLVSVSHIGHQFTSKPALADSARVVSIFCDGQKKVVTSDAPTVGDLLKRTGVKLSAGDRVEPAAGTKIIPGYFNINVYRARPVAVIDGGKAYKLRSASQSPKALATGAGVTVYPEDQYSTEVITDLIHYDAVGQKVVIKRAKPLKVKVDGKDLTFRTQAGTIKDALTERNIALGPKDTVAPGLDVTVNPDLNVTVTRVSEMIVEKDELLPRATKLVDDNSLEVGHKAVKNDGADGKRRITYRINYRDGREVARQTINVTGLVNPQPKVIAVGTKITDSIWYRLRQCESGNNYDRDNGNGYYGAYQFELGTWQSNGGIGLPSEAAPELQDTIAKRIQARRGWEPWPSCAASLGLL